MSSRRPERERRSGLRRPVSLPARLSSDHLVVTAHLGDVSHRGLFVRSDYLEPPGTCVSLRVARPTGGFKLFRGRVAWVDERPGRSGMGVSLCTEESPIEELALTGTDD